VAFTTASLCIACFVDSNVTICASSSWFARVNRFAAASPSLLVFIATSCHSSASFCFASLSNSNKDRRVSNEARSCARSSFRDFSLFLQSSRSCSLNSSLVSKSDLRFWNASLRTAASVVRAFLLASNACISDSSSLLALNDASIFTSHSLTMAFLVAVNVAISACRSFMLTSHCRLASSFSFFTFMHVACHSSASLSASSS